MDRDGYLAGIENMGNIICIEYMEKYGYLVGIKKFSQGRCLTMYLQFE
jgi:hypothetical protein